MHRNQASPSRQPAWRGVTLWSGILALTLGCGARSGLPIFDDASAGQSNAGSAHGGAGNAHGGVGGALSRAGAAAGGAASGGGGAGGAPPMPCENDAVSWIAFDSDREDLDREIYIIHPDGSGLRRLTHHPGPDVEPAFASDGKSIVFSSQIGSARQVCSLQIENGGVVTLTQHPEGANHPALSQDRTTLAFEGGSAVFVRSVNRDDERLVAAAMGMTSAYRHPQFAPGGQALVVDRFNEIDLLALDGTKKRQIVSNWTTQIEAPAMSRDGRDVAYQVACELDNGVSLWTSPFSVQTDPCKGQRLTLTSEGSTEHPTWSPGGDCVAFARVDVISQHAKIALASRRKLTTGTPITSGPFDDRNPSWSP